MQGLGDPKKAQFLQGFFQTGPGGYGEGDILLGIRVPVLRKLVKEYQSLTVREVLPLLRSPIHEERLLALLILVNAYAKGNEPTRRQMSDPLKIALLLLADTEDLIQKAVGWMLREVGKRDLPRAEAFLHVHYQQMPRTMLRYAIEKFPEPQRRMYLEGKM